jgi:EAL domain-containing protein (putative c-di-GMP-specific phosphodiesterase class I)
MNSIQPVENPIVASQRSWTLTEFGEGMHQQRTIVVPLRSSIVGRDNSADICIPSNSVSKRHATLSVEDSQLLVVDLGSTNGTHVNGVKIECSVVTEGDLLQFANALYRVGRLQSSNGDGTLEEGIVPWAQTLLMFEQLLNERAVTPHFQPIVTMQQQTTVAYEALARSSLEGLTNPAAMFGAAERLGQHATLSELLRTEAIQAVQKSNQSQSEFFLNTHPVEVVNDRLLDSLTTLREEFPTTRLTIEIHEASVTHSDDISRLRDHLRQLDMRLSYDDFGAGQGRLLELGDVPPDVLKFDMGLIRDIDKAASNRQEMLASLVRMSTDLGATPLAEGVETEAEHTTCLSMGFELGQGYYYARPAPL